MKSTQDSQNKAEVKHLGFLEIAVLVLSVYVLGALLVQAVFKLSPEVNSLLDGIDSLICLVFIADFCIRYRRASSKAAFLKWGWIDLVSSIPAVGFLRWGRLVRLIRIFRMLRAFRSAKHLMAFLYRNRTRSLVGTAALSAAVLVISSSIAILAFETDKDSNIKTPFDAVWWAFSTVTTVGYGDRYPVTVEGRLVAIVLMVAGVGLFGVLTGLFARLFLESEWKSDESDLGKLATEIRLLREKIEQMEQRQSNQTPRPP